MTIGGDTKENSMSYILKLGNYKTNNKMYLKVIATCSLSAKDG